MADFAQTLSDFVVGFGATGGGIGLLVIGFFDSSLLSLPEVNDLLIIYFCTKFKQHAYYFAFMATLGSTLGCIFLYSLVRWRGFSYVKRRFAGRRLDTTLKWLQRFGAFALVVPAVMPPPFPFKIFVFSAGLTGVPLRHFVLAIVLGRGARYFAEAYFSLRYGEEAMQFVKANYTYLLGGVVSVVLVALVFSTVRRARKLADVSVDS